jgi:1-acyl-sn-glycerol-3-phosphate acyltransferase
MKFLFHIEIIGNEYIPLDEGVVLAGNHKSNFDCFLLISSTKRTIRFLAKKELMDKCSWLFKHMAIIPVDRKRKNKEAVSEAINVLKDNGVVGIFPEGTFNNTEYVVRNFKIGAVKMACDSNKKIVPFAIINKYKLFRKSVKIVFGKPYKIKNKNDLKSENVILMNKVIDLLKGEKNGK